MTLAEFFGCAFLAFGPPVSMFALTIVQDPILIIITIISAFMWLLSLLLSSLLWFAVVPLKTHLWFGLIFSVIFQEIFRFFLFQMLRRAQAGLSQVAESSQLVKNRHMQSYVCGVGFGMISCAFSLVNVLADAVGPGTVGLQQGSSVFFIESASCALMMFLLHVFWGIVFFDGLTAQKYWIPITVGFSHLLVSCLTLVTHVGYSWIPLSVGYITMIVMGVWAFRTAGGSVSTIKRALTCSVPIILNVAAE